MKYKVNTNINLRLAKLRFDLKSCRSNWFVSDPSYYEYFQVLHFVIKSVLAINCIMVTQHHVHSKVLKARIGSIIVVKKEYFWI